MIWSASRKDSLLSSRDTKTYFARARVRDSREKRHPGKYKSSLALHNNSPLGSTGRWPVVRGSLPRTSLAPKARCQNSLGASSQDCDRILPSARFLWFASGAISALTSRRDQIILGAVSASEIIRELPKLTEAERRAIRVGLLEIANQDPDVALSNQSALEGALMLDRLENDDARHQSG